MRRLRHAMLMPAFLLAACQAGPTTAPPNLGIANETTVTVMLFVNGSQVGDVAPGGVQPSVEGSALPPLPWTVTVRSASGQVLGTMSATTTTDGTFGAEFGDLACGRVTVWIGATEPSEPSDPGGGSPGSSLTPCGP